MSSAAAQQPDATPVVACTISRDISKFDLLIEDMETELGESWGDLGFDEAVDFLQQPDSASLEFIAIAVDAKDEGNLGRIADIVKAAKERGIKAILIADEISPMALHQLLKLGADDFVPYPLPEAALHDAIERLRRVAQTPPVEAAAMVAGGENRQGIVYPVHGLAGGTGATTLAVNLAWELATLDKNNPPRVCLLDLDFQTGSVSTYLDLPRREAVYELLSDTAAMDHAAFLQTLVTFKDKLHVLTAPSDMLPLDIVTSEDINRILDTARANFDFVIVDMPRTVVQWTEAVLNQAHVYFAMIELDMRSAQNTLRMIRALKAEDLPFEKLRYVLNRAPKFTDLSGKGRVKRLAESLDIKIEIQLPDGGKQVTDSNDHGLPLAETVAKSPLRKEIMKMAQTILEHGRAAATAGLV